MKFPDKLFAANVRAQAALVYPCHKSGTEWVDASNKKHIDFQPTHWRKWTELTERRSNRLQQGSA
jgi:hypothetical protein